MSEECKACKGSGVITVWEPVPWSELADWQIAETLVNGGEYRRKVDVPCNHK